MVRVPIQTDFESLWEFLSSHALFVLDYQVSFLVIQQIKRINDASTRVEIFAKVMLSRARYCFCKTIEKAECVRCIHINNSELRMILKLHIATNIQIHRLGTAFPPHSMAFHQLRNSTRPFEISFILWAIRSHSSSERGICETNSTTEIYLWRSIVSGENLRIKNICVIAVRTRKTWKAHRRIAGDKGNIVKLSDCWKAPWLVMGAIIWRCSAISLGLNVARYDVSEKSARCVSTSSGGNSGMRLRRISARVASALHGAFMNCSLVIRSSMMLRAFRYNSQRRSSFHSVKTFLFTAERSHRSIHIIRVVYVFECLSEIDYSLRIVEVAPKCYLFHEKMMTDKECNVIDEIIVIIRRRNRAQSVCPLFHVFQGGGLCISWNKHARYNVSLRAKNGIHPKRRSWLL